MNSNYSMMQMQAQNSIFNNAGGLDEYPMHASQQAMFTSFSMGPPHPIGGIQPLGMQFQLPSINMGSLGPQGGANQLFSN